MKPRIRILLLTPHLDGGGAEKVIALLAAGLSPEKYEVHLGLMTQAAPPAGAFPAGVTLHGLAAGRVCAGAGSLLRLVRRLRPQVVLSGMFHLNFLVLLLRPLFPAGTHVIIRQNGSLSASLAFYTRLLYRLLYRRADRVICQSAAMAAELASTLKVAKARLAVLPNPVEVDAIRARVEGLRSQWTGPGPHLLAVGRLSREKGFDSLLQALVAVRIQFPSADLVIAGDGPEEGPLLELRRKLGLDAAVHFAGHVADPFRFFPAATAFVLSSHHEGMPNALLEAAAAGLAIVSTPASQGLVDLLGRHPGVWLAADSSSTALTTALVQALHSLEQASLEPDQRFPHTFIDAFRLDRAVAAFEHLIDATCEERQP
jgi:glycosyltransferase involved in cell wall biosynthesis